MAEGDANLNAAVGHLTVKLNDFKRKNHNKVIFMKQHNANKLQLNKKS